MVCGEDQGRPKQAAHRSATVREHGAAGFAAYGQAANRSTSAGARRTDASRETLAELERDVLDAAADSRQAAKPWRFSREETYDRAF